MSLHDYQIPASRKDIVEKAIVQKRNQDAERQKKCESAARYHRDLNLLSSQYKRLDEQQTNKISKVNEESRLIEAAKVDKKEKLLQRRERLAKLLGKEGELHLVEMKTLENVEQKNDPWNITKLKEQIEDLRKHREEEEEELRKKNYYQLFQETNIPYVKEHNIKLSDDEMKQAMELRKQELEEQALKRKSDEEHQLNDLQIFREETWKSLKAFREEKKEDLEDYVKLAQEKMKVYEDNKLQVSTLDGEFQLINKYQNVIDGVQERRQKVQKIQEEKKEKISQFRPSKEKVRKMCSEVRHGLELDLATLNYLSQLEIRQREIVNVQIDMDKVMSAIDIVKERMDIEDNHIEQIQLMFEEEATLCWDMWKNDWQEIANSQDKLIPEVSDDLVNQLEQVVVKIDRCCKQLEATNLELHAQIKKDREEHNRKLQIFQEQEDYYLKLLNEAEQRIQRIVNARKKSLLHS